MTRRIRVAVIDWNGGDRTRRCLGALTDAGWSGGEFELVLVDNGSTDDTAARVRAELPHVHVVRNESNLGFTGGVNTALRDLDEIDAVAIVNNDAVVEAGWLEPLVAALDADDDLGAACPKILLADRYLDVELTTDASRRHRIDPRPLGVRVSAVRVGDDDAWTRTRFLDGFWGPETGPPPEAAFQWSAGRAQLRVPVPDDGPIPSCELRLAADEPRPVRLTSGTAAKEHLVGTEPAWYPAPLDGVPFDVVNNVGTTLVRDAYGADRGWLERDDGQFERREEVFAWCGAAALLRTEYVRDVGLLDERLFMYSEDLEHSWRGRHRGWRYEYVPQSVVRHEHAATSGEGSAAKTFLDERNHLLVVTRHGDRRLVTRTLADYLFITASYARRDVLTPKLVNATPNATTVRARLRALGGWARLAPAMIRDRRADRSRTPRS